MLTAHPPGGVGSNETRQSTGNADVGVALNPFQVTAWKGLRMTFRSTLIRRGSRWRSDGRAPHYGLENWPHEITPRHLVSDGGGTRRAPGKDVSINEKHNLENGQRRFSKHGPERIIRDDDGLVALVDQTIVHEDDVERAPDIPNVQIKAVVEKFPFRKLVPQIHLETGPVNPHLGLVRVH